MTWFTALIPGGVPETLAEPWAPGRMPMTLRDYVRSEGGVLVVQTVPDTQACMRVFHRLCGNAVREGCSADLIITTNTKDMVTVEDMGRFMSREHGSRRGRRR